MSIPKKKMLRLSKQDNQVLTLAERLSISEDLTQNAIVPLLDEKSFHAFTLSCKNYHNQYEDKYADKKVAAEMLHCVLNPTLPNQARFLELLAMPKRDQHGQPLYLIQNHGEEVYVNKDNVQKTKTIRYSTNVLEAIFRTKNFHLAKKLFHRIPEPEKTENLKRRISLLKSQDIWGMPELQSAYKNFLGPWQSLFDASKWDELGRLTGRIGQVQKEHLPWFSIYLFSDLVPHSEADYSQAPNWACILWDGSKLDFDSFGSDSTHALYKGSNDACWGRLVLPPSDAKLDSRAFASQCKVLSAELDKTIKRYGLDEPKPELTTKPTFG